MGEIVNLRMARKAKARTAKERAADSNRAAHGETKAAKANRKADQTRTDRLLDGAKLDHD